MQSLIQKTESNAKYRFKIELDKENFRPKTSSDLREFDLTGSSIRANAPDFKKIIGKSGIISCVTISLRVSEISAFKNHYAAFKLAGDSANVITSRLMARITQFDSNTVNAKKPVSKSEDQEELEIIFNGLVEKWKSETFLYSSMSQVYTNSNFISILSMGKDALPLILNELQKDSSGRWFFALNRITRQDIPKESGAENFNEAKEAWLKWGRDQQII